MSIYLQVIPLQVQLRMAINAILIIRIYRFTIHIYVCAALETLNRQFGLYCLLLHVSLNLRRIIVQLCCYIDRANNKLTKSFRYHAFYMAYCFGSFVIIFAFYILFPYSYFIILYTISIHYLSTHKGYNLCTSNFK